MTRKRKSDIYYYKTSIVLKPTFSDLDPIGVVWHGTYVRYFEQAREALLANVGYSYDVMLSRDELWPIVDINIKYRASILYQEEVTVTAFIMEVENYLKIGYEAVGADGTLKADGYTVQVCVDKLTKETLLVCKEEFIKCFSHSLRIEHEAV